MKLATLVPAFKFQFFEELLLALQNQTVKPTRIIVSDDSPNDSFLAFGRSKRFRRLSDGLEIEFIRGPKRGHYANFRRLVQQLDQSEICFHLLCDDDLIYPEFYKRHLQAHLEDGVVCSFSKRKTVTERGRETRAPDYPPEISPSGNDVLTPGTDYLFQSTLPRMNNWLGEFSNTVFKSSTAPLFSDPFLNGICHYGLYDLGLYLRCSLSGRVLIINECLGAFRKSKLQHSSNIQSPTFRSSVGAWIALGAAAYQLEKISAPQFLTCSKTTMRLLRQMFPGDSLVQQVLTLEVLLDQGQIERFIEEFLSLWPQFLAHVDTRVQAH